MLRYNDQIRNATWYNGLFYFADDFPKYNHLVATKRTHEQMKKLNAYVECEECQHTGSGRLFYIDRRLGTIVCEKCA